MMPELVFDAASHIYTVDGARKPSVTSIITEVFDTDLRWFKQIHREKGQRIHSLCTQIARLEADGTEEWDQTLPGYPELIPYGVAFQRWMQEVRFTLAWAETPVYSPSLEVTGTPDLVGTIGKHGVVIDIKSGGVPEYVGIQLAAYRRLVREYHGREIAKVFSLQLGEDNGRGTYKMRDCTDVNAEPVFVSAVNIYRWKQAHNLLAKDRSGSGPGRNANGNGNHY